MAHTPGPWEACSPGDYSDYDGRCRVILGDDLRVAVVLGDHDESKANAHLIAASPDLLEALEHAERVMDNPDCEPGNSITNAIAKARAAIAKAKGGDV